MLNSSKVGKRRQSVQSKTKSRSRSKSAKSFKKSKKGRSASKKKKYPDNWRVSSSHNNIFHPGMAESLDPSVNVTNR